MDLLKNYECEGQMTIDDYLPKKKSRTQRERILDYMRQYGSITPLDAFRDLGITKLATQISYMIRDGYAINKSYEKNKNRFGEDCHYMRYSLREG